MIVTDIDFWLNDRGSRKRIDSLYQELASRFDVWLLFLGRASPSSHKVLSRRYPNTQFAAPVPIDDLGSRRRSVFLLAMAVVRRARSMMCRYLLGPCLRGIGWIRGRPGAEGAGVSNYFDEPILSDFWNEENIQRFLAACRDLKPRAVIVEYIRLSYLVQAAREEANLEEVSYLLDTHDVMHARCADFHRHGCRHWIRIAREEERAALSEFDVILAIQDDDAARLAELVPNKEIVTVGHPTPMIPFESKEHTDCLRVLLLAAGDPSNVYGLSRFLETTWKEVLLEAGCQIHLDVVGLVCRGLQLATIHESVTLHGYVENVEGFYRSADVVINPVVFGGGLKIKNAEALSYGKPLVTTPEGARGFRWTGEPPFVVVADLVEMATAICRLARSGNWRRDLSLRAYNYALMNFTKEAAYGRLLTILETVCGESDLMNSVDAR